MNNLGASRFDEQLQITITDDLPYISTEALLKEIYRRYDYSICIIVKGEAIVVAATDDKKLNRFYLNCARVLLE